MRRLAALGLAMVAACQSPESPGESVASLPGSDFEGPAFEIEQVMEGVYQARGTGNVAVGSNAAVIINDDDVLLVDSHISPAAASALLSELATITDKPVRYVVNTHFHFDHAHGNQIYPPEVEVIGHEFTREMLANGESVGRTYQGFHEAMAAQPGYVEGQEGLVPTPPTTTLSERMTLHRGGREIRLLFFGRGHTGGDIVVHLPRERALITGDLLLPGVPFMGDGFPEDWVDTLEELKALPVDVVIPGHGAPFSDLGRIDALQSYLGDLWARTAEARSAGLTPSEAAEQIDMSDHADDYPSITGPGVPLTAIARMYELMGG
ncbi:MAG TPA: MBL fold metallo-hydrolase [Longimicrobiales bacterium]|nr:MBL fold metallo-hydrolase [Longimicrobiales bacterium]